MSLKVLDRWANLGPHMSKHWDKVATNVSKSHPCLPPKRSSSPVVTTTDKPTTSTPAASKKGWDHFTPAKMRARRSSVGPLTERDTDVDGVSEHPPAHTAGPTSSRASLSGIREENPDDDDDEKELQLLRKWFRKWCRKAGVQAEAGGELEEDEVDCDWTRAIAPKLEGRIVMLGGGVGGGKEA